MNYITKVYKDDNGDRLVVADGGALNTQVTAVTATSLAVTAADYDGRTIVLNSTTGQAITLPAASGSGARYKIVLAATVSSGSTTVKVANSSDTMAGVALHAADGGDTIVGFETTAGSDTITFNGGSTGGIKGAKVMLEDVATNLYHVEVLGAASGTEATPFSATV